MRIGGRLGGCEEQDCGLQQQQACQAERSRCPSGLHLAWAFTAGWLQPGDRACVQARLELRAARSLSLGPCCTQFQTTGLVRQQAVCREAPLAVGFGLQPWNHRCLQL